MQNRENVFIKNIPHVITGWGDRVYRDGVACVAKIETSNTQENTVSMVCKNLLILEISLERKGEMVAGSQCFCKTISYFTIPKIERVFLHNMICSIAKKENNSKEERGEQHIAAKFVV
jgi:hypothetical protein